MLQKQPVRMWKPHNDARRLTWEPNKSQIIQTSVHVHVQQMKGLDHHLCETKNSTIWSEQIEVYNRTLLSGISELFVAVIQHKYASLVLVTHRTHFANHKLSENWSVLQYIRQLDAWKYTWPILVVNRRVYTKYLHTPSRIKHAGYFKYGKS